MQNKMLTRMVVRVYEQAETIVEMAHSLIRRRAWVWDGPNRTPLIPRRIGVVCAHVSQVSAVRERLTGDLSEVFVETADRYQGLERRVMLVYHPLSGRADASFFHLDTGRMCVMMSRHSVACFIFSRGGVEEMLNGYVPSGNRILGIEEDPEYQGWYSHRQMMRQLRRLDRAWRVNR